MGNLGNRNAYCYGKKGIRLAYRKNVKTRLSLAFHAKASLEKISLVNFRITEGWTPSMQFCALYGTICRKKYTYK